MKKVILYFIPIFGLIFMLYKPYETNSIQFAFYFTFWQIVSSFCIFYYFIFEINYA